MTTTADTDATTTTDAAWAFVLRHETMIRKFCHRFAPSGLDHERRREFETDVVLKIVDRHHTLRLEGARDRTAVISTWIGWQVRAVRSAYLRDWIRHAKDVSPSAPDKERGEQWFEFVLPIPDGGYGHHDVAEAGVRRADARSVVETAYGLASATERRRIVAALSTGRVPKSNTLRVLFQRALNAVEAP